MVPGGDLVVFFCRCLCKDALFNSSVGGCITLYFLVQLLPSGRVCLVDKVNAMGGSTQETGIWRIHLISCLEMSFRKQARSYGGNMSGGVWVGFK